MVKPLLLFSAVTSVLAAVLPGELFCYPRECGYDEMCFPPHASWAQTSRFGEASRIDDG
jgi:hypothetical protein